MYVVGVLLYQKQENRSALHLSVDKEGDKGNRGKGKGHLKFFWMVRGVQYIEERGACGGGAAVSEASSQISLTSLS